MYLVNLAQDSSKINPYISNTLLEKIEENLKENKKIILYINKRWEYSSLICEKCNYLYKCKNCDTSLSVHKFPEKLICHICSDSKIIPTKCEKCNSSNLRRVWIWTQQIEDILKNYFWEKIKIFRLDSDNVKNKSAKFWVLEEIKNSNIIIWTKMITTWFDFIWIWLIWIILLEQELLIPKYNTEEKVISNIKQLIWRWSRVWEKTEVIIQTFIPENQIIKNITTNNYKDFFIKTLEERKLFNYPPFTEMITLEYRNPKKEKAYNFILNLKNKLDLENKENIEIKLSNSFTKKYNQYHYKIILKWKDLREFLLCIKPEIMRNSWLIVIFD